MWNKQVKCDEVQYGYLKPRLDSSYTTMTVDMFHYHEWNDIDGLQPGRLTSSDTRLGLTILSKSVISSSVSKFRSSRNKSVGLTEVCCVTEIDDYEIIRTGTLIRL